MSEKNFSNLLDYYIACLEQEDLLSVTFNVSSENSTFLSTPFQTEVLFHTNNTQVIVKNIEGVKKFFQTSLLRQKNNTLFYGYPVIITAEGTISPLFFIELQYEQKDDVILLNNQTRNYTLNHHILVQHHFSPEEIRSIRDGLENEDFHTAFESLCTLLHFTSSACTSTLDQQPFKRVNTPTLRNKAILYFAEPHDITHNLLVELTQLKNKPYDELASTSLLFLLSHQYQQNKNTQTNTILLETFPLNPAQQKAVTHALNKTLTVITGPPGTGKSQVVLNIIANAVYQNKTVLFASKNNKAVDVVIQKLNAILPYKLIIRMGHRTHRKNAKADVEHLLNQPIQIKPVAERTFNDLNHLHIQLKGIQNQIRSMTQLNDAINTLQTTIHESRKHCPYNLSGYEKHNNVDFIDPLELEEDLKKFFKKPHYLTLLSPRRYQHNQQRCFKKYYDLLPYALRTSLQNSITNNAMTKEMVLSWILTLRKEKLTLDEIKKIKCALLALPSYTSLKQKHERYHKQYVAFSQTLFIHHWINKFRNIQENEIQQILSYFSLSEQLESSTTDTPTNRHLHSKRVHALQNSLKFFPAWVVTNLSAKNSFPLKNNLFDILIIDEASQCDIASALPLFYRTKHIVIIGDPFQLKHISLLTETQDRLLAASHHVPEHIHTAFSYQKHSLYDLAEHIFRTQGETPLLLNEHYRCHPDIVSFSNEYYYGRNLMIATDETHLLHHPSINRRALWHHIKGKTVHTKSPYNVEEAERVVEEILKILEVVSSLHATIGVVTLFRAQTEIITEKLHTFQEVFDLPITIGTAHRFQGDEKDIIVFSPAVSEGVKPGTLQWVRTTNQLINVAVTRARSLFIVIGDQETCSQTTGPLKNLYEYIEHLQTNTYTTDSPVKQRFFEELKKQSIPIVPNFLVKGLVPYQVDFALFVNGHRYIIEIDDRQKKIDRTQAQKDHWKMRLFTEEEILNRLPEVIDELQRIC